MRRSGVRTTVWKTLGLLLVVGPMGCSDPTSPTQELLDGDGTWVESSGGITGWTQTPESTGETMSLRFQGGHSVEVFRNDAVEGTTTYRLVSSDDGTTSIEYAQGIFGFVTQGLSETQDVLILSDGCCDGFVYRFERAS
jgi:hypothetical protein